MVAVKNSARRLGDDISEAKSILDLRLSDGSRLAAVIPTDSLGGVTLTNRKSCTNRTFSLCGHSKRSKRVVC
jgi:Flp pilus assembly CpaF family ATPase